MIDPNKLAVAMAKKKVLRFYDNKIGAPQNDQDYYMEDTLSFSAMAVSSGIEIKRAVSHFGNISRHIDRMLHRIRK
jgi:hypothetical protein